MNLVVIDPGKSGGVVLVKGDAVSTLATPGDDMDKLVGALQEMPADTLVFIELVGGYVGKDQPGAYMFEFGRNFGWFFGYAAARGWSVKKIVPTAWQIPLNIGQANERVDKAQWKRDLKAKATEMFPEHKPTLATADALLIWAYVRDTLLKPKKTRPVGQVDYKAARLKRLAGASREG